MEITKINPKGPVDPSSSQANENIRKSTMKVCYIGASQPIFSCFYTAHASAPFNYCPLKYGHASSRHGICHKRTDIVHVK